MSLSSVVSNNLSSYLFFIPFPNKRVFQITLFDMIEVKKTYFMVIESKLCICKSFKRRARKVQPGSRQTNGRYLIWKINKNIKSISDCTNALAWYEI
jgi:hypothetical protein